MKEDNKTNLIMADERDADSSLQVFDERDADSSLEIFDERLHPLTVSNNLHSCLFRERIKVAKSFVPFTIHRKILPWTHLGT